MKLHFLIIPVAIVFIQFSNSSSVPFVINTWSYYKATAKAWQFILNGRSHLDALEAGCSVCEHLQCDETVGYGGNTDENGETTLDAQIFNGATMDMGAVGGIRRIKNAISVARRVLDRTEHSLLVGDLATKFAVKMGFQEESLVNENTLKKLLNWKMNQCMPNFWKNFWFDQPDTCKTTHQPIYTKQFNRKLFIDNNHDTIGMIVIDKDNNIAAGTTTNGPKFKIPGRVGDSPIPGAGAYAENSVGAAVATGNGDIMMRFLPSFLSVEEMRRGKSPLQAARMAINRIVDFYPHFFGAVIAVNKTGAYAAACNGMKNFSMSIANPETRRVIIKHIACKQPRYENTSENYYTDHRFQ